MDILIQSVLRNANRFGSSVYIRYLERKGQPVKMPKNGKNGKEVELIDKSQDDKSQEMRKESYVIIHRPYSYLESVVRPMFEQAEDVKVLVDRRFHERRQVSAFLGIADRRKLGDRRQATPMLDILINVGS